MPPKALFVGPSKVRKKPKFFVQSKRDCEASNHISAIMLLRTLAYMAGDMKIKQKDQTGKKGKSKSLHDISNCFSRALAGGRRKFSY